MLIRKKQETVKNNIYSSQFKDNFSGKNLKENYITLKNKIKLKCKTNTITYTNFYIYLITHTMSCIHFHITYIKY